MYSKELTEIVPNLSDGDIKLLSDYVKRQVERKINVYEIDDSKINLVCVDVGRVTTLKANEIMNTIINNFNQIGHNNKCVFLATRPENTTNVYELSSAPTVIKIEGFHNDVARAYYKNVEDTLNGMGCNVSVLLVQPETTKITKI